MKRARVLVVDDSALMRELLADILSRDPGIEVIGTASDPYTAWNRIQLHQPDVLTLDVEMPRMDGLTFLAKLMRLRPMPVVMVSSLTERGGETTLRALELGAIDFVTKPRVDMASGIVAMADSLCEKIRTAATVRLGRRPALAGPPLTSAPRRPSAPGFTMTHGVIAVGASTGGTEALRELITALPADSPGMVVVQHMPERFTRLFATRIDGLSRVHVKEAEDGDAVLPGHVLIAPGNQHMEVRRSGTAVTVNLHDGAPVNRHRPSVDVLFDSCARHLGANATGVILTGMGADGARGLLAMRNAGAHTIAQDEASCVVFGMPREAIAAGAAASVLPLGAIAAAVIYR